MLTIVISAFLLNLVCGILCYVIYGEHTKALMILQFKSYPGRYAIMTVLGLIVTSLGIAYFPIILSMGVVLQLVMAYVSRLTEQASIKAINNNL